MNAIKRFQTKITRILAHQIVAIELSKLRRKPTKADEQDVRERLEWRYRCAFSKVKGATWKDYMRKPKLGKEENARNMAKPLIRKLVNEYRLIPRREMRKEEEWARNKLMNILVAFEHANPAHDSLMEPDFMRRLQRVESDLIALRDEALKAETIIKATAMEDVLRPILDELEYK